MCLTDLISYFILNYTLTWAKNNKNSLNFALFNLKLITLACKAIKLAESGAIQLKINPSKKQKVLNAKLVTWQASNEEIRSCILEDRENNGKFVCFLCGLSGKITDKTQIIRHYEKERHVKSLKTVNFVYTLIYLPSLCKGRSR